MRYLGNKEKLVSGIFQLLAEEGVTGSTMFDVFAGTTSVSKYFKTKGYKVFSNDLMYFSYVLQKAYLSNNFLPTFSGLISHEILNITFTFNDGYEKVIKLLNEATPCQGFIYHHYSPGGTKELEQPRMFLSDDNAQKIDGIRIQIEQWWKNDYLTENEYYILLASLLESVSRYSNVSGVYAAFHKQWDCRAIKPFRLRSIQLIIGSHQNEAFNCDSLDLLEIIEADILYLDPPYNERQYAPNYHLLETIVKYDEPEIHGVAGIREYTQQKSNFCNKVNALRDLEEIVRRGKYKYLVLSYNNEGIMSQEQIMKILEKFGEVKFREIQYARFKSNNKGEQIPRNVIEQLFILQKKY